MSFKKSIGPLCIIIGILFFIIIIIINVIVKTEKDNFYNNHIKTTCKILHLENIQINLNNYKQILYVDFNYLHQLNIINSNITIIKTCKIETNCYKYNCYTNNNCYNQNDLTECYYKTYFTETTNNNEVILQPTFKKLGIFNVLLATVGSNLILLPLLYYIIKKLVDKSSRNPSIQRNVNI
jgi:hypothetical protein